MRRARAGSAPGQHGHFQAFGQSHAPVEHHDAVLDVTMG